MALANRLSSPRGQRGAAAIFAALSLVALLSALALAIDVGRLYNAHRDLQRLADLAAVDGARVRSQCLGSAGIDEVTAEVNASLARNGVPDTATKLTLLGKRQSIPGGLDYFQPATATGPADSVQVTLSQTSPARILPLFSSEAGGTITARAAAQAEWTASAEVQPDPARLATSNFLPQFYGSALRAGLGSGGGGFLGGLDATVAVGDLVEVNAGGQLPAITTPVDVLGLLSSLESALNATGDAAAAQLVGSFSDAVAIGRPGATVVPAEVLGLPLQGGYDSATASVGSVLGSIAGSLSQGDVIALPNLCGLLPLDQLPTAQLLPALCDSTVELSIPQPSRPATFNSLTQIDVNNDDNAATTAGGLLRVRIKLVNPLNGQRISLPLEASIDPGQASVTELSCARLGQDQHIATVIANGPAATFTLGESNRFDAAFGSRDVDLTGVLDDVVPTRLITASVGDVLSSAGLGALVSNPLFAGFLGQPVTVSVVMNPIRIGDGRTEEFCMQGPPYRVPEQCNGQPSNLGGVSTEQAVSDLAVALGSVRLRVQLPAGLPLGLSAPLQSAVSDLTATLSQQLQAALQLLAPQVVPLLQSANLAIGDSNVYLTDITTAPPKVYAQ